MEIVTDTEIELVKELKKNGRYDRDDMIAIAITARKKNICAELLAWLKERENPSVEDIMRFIYPKD